MIYAEKMLNSNAVHGRYGMRLHVKNDCRDYTIVGLMELPRYSIHDSKRHRMIVDVAAGGFFCFVFLEFLFMSYPHVYGKSKG